MQETVKQDRNKYIGGSDIPVIMNLSPFKSRYDLLLEKAGVKEDTFEGNIYTEYGNALEPQIREYLNEGLQDNQKYVEGKHTREAEAGEIIGARAHTDGENDTSILEIKTTGTIYKNVNDYKIYLVQLLFYMVMTGKETGYLAVYERPENFNTEFEANRLHIYTIYANEYDNLIADIETAVNKFIDDLKKVIENPFITESELLPVEIPEITSRILAFESQLNYLKEVEKTIKAEKERLAAAMEVASVKSWKTPNGYKITLVEGTEAITETSETLDIEALKADMPELFETEDNGGYMKVTTTVKKGRKAYIKITEPKEKGAQSE